MKVEPKVSRVKSQQHLKLGKTLELDRRLNRDQRPAQTPNLLSINSNVLLIWNSLVCVSLEKHSCPA